LPCLCPGNTPESSETALIRGESMAVVQKLPCWVEQIIHHGDHVYTVTLRPERPAPRFRPGQFLHLAMDTYDPSGFWPESRVFSIANSLLHRDQLRISYSVRGRFTARMERELAEGGQVSVKMPYGEFVVNNTGDVVLFAGGTGITAFTAFLEGLSPGSRHAVYLAYGARTRSLLIYRELVQQRAQTVPSLHVSYFIEQEPGARPAMKESDELDNIGRLSVAAMWPKIKRPREATYYISGPPAMLKVISQDLRSIGIGAEAIKIDAWE
jgi:ferredoxin-NADP reductase